MKTSKKINALLTLALIVCASLQTFAQEVDSMLLMYREQQRQLQEMMNPTAPAPSAESQRSRAQNESARRVGNFSMEAAFATSWYPLSTVNYFESEEPIAEYELDPMRNLGLSAIMNMRFFKKYWANMDIKIDDPIMRQTLQYIGYFNYNGWLFKYDHHSFAGDITWEGDPARNPFDNGETETSFRTSWNTISLLYNIVQGWADEWGGHGVVGIGPFYANANVPMLYEGEYETGGETFKAYGFGDTRSNLIGLTALIDVMHEEIMPGPNKKGWEGWIYLNGFAGLGWSSYDTDAIRRMETLYGLESGDIYNGSDPSLATLLRAHFIYGINRRWKIGNMAEAGLALGLDLKVDMLVSDGAGILTTLDLINFGPVVRLSARF